MAAEVAAVGDALDVAALEGVAGIVVIRRDVNASGLADDARSGKADATGADGELIRRAAEERSHRPGVGVVVIDHDVQPARVNVLPHRHGAFRHLGHAKGAFLNADAASGVNVGQQGPLFAPGDVAGLDEFLSLR